jgi:hypothetical protein
MKVKTTSFYGTKVQPWTRRVRQESAQFLLRHSVIFANLYERQESKKGIFFALRAKLTRFTVNEVEPRLKRVKGRLAGFAAAIQTRLAHFRQSLTGLTAAGQAGVAQVKEQVSGWMARRKRAIWIAAVVVAIVITGVALVLFWQRSPVFRAIVRTLSVAALGALVSLWALLKGLGLTLGQGMSSLGQSLPGLGAGLLTILGRLSPRFSRPVIEIVIISPGGETVPIPSVNSHRGL